MSTTQLGVAIIFCSFYAISGAPIATQRLLWRQLAEDLLALGKLFVVAADWQRHPADLRASGICDMLDAEICAPSCATNVNSGGNSITSWFPARCCTAAGTFGRCTGAYLNPTSPSCSPSTSTRPTPPRDG